MPWSQVMYRSPSFPSSSSSHLQPRVAVPAPASPKLKEVVQPFKFTWLSKETACNCPGLKIKAILYLTLHHSKVQSEKFCFKTFTPIYIQNSALWSCQLPRFLIIWSASIKIIQLHFGVQVCILIRTKRMSVFSRNLSGKKKLLLQSL